MTTRLLSLLIGTLFIVGLTAAPAVAQGNGKGRPKDPKNTTTPSPAPAPTPAPSADSGDSSTTAPVTTPTATVSFRQFGSWLDDASAPTRGEGYTSIGIGHWRMTSVSQTNIPMLGVGYGITDRMQVGASLPFYRVTYADGSVSGLDDVYLSAKYTILDPTLTVSEVGFAVSPVLEVLSSGAPDGRVHFAIPVSVELRRAPMRVYASAGYFSRGAVFTGGALEWSSPAGMTITGSLTQSYSTPSDAQLEAMGISRQRVDASAGVAFPLTTRAVAYGSVGRSLSSVAEGGTTLALSGGVSIRFSAPQATP